MMKTLASAIAATLLFTCGSEPGAEPPADSPPSGKPRILVVTETEGFRHASIPVAEETLAAIARDDGDLEVAFARTAGDVRAMLAPSALEAFAAVFFVNTTGEIPVPDVAALVAWVADGHAFLGAHAATDTLHGSPAYLAMIGAELAQHGAPCTVRPKVEDGAHPAVAHLAPSFEVFDEIYEWRQSPRPVASVLLSLDAHPPDGHPGAGQPGDYPLAWTRAHGKGRVFYTALGHGDDVWKDPRFQRHLLGAMRWSVGAS